MNKGLYIHFPFCEKKCNYCDFYSLANISKKEEYVNSILREIKKTERLKLDTVYFGGGTPSLMDGVQLQGILDSIRQCHDLSENAEITLEANPMTLSHSHKLSELRSVGINRLSLGVQSFSNEELLALGRGHSASDAVDTVRSAQQAGFDNLSLDLMFAIPYQTVKSFETGLDLAISLGVQHVSVYALSIEEKTVFGVKQKRGEDLHLPNEDEEAEMYFLACKKLNEAGFEHYEISNFAKDGKRSRHNMKYWLGEEYVGIGASAHSYFKGERYSTPADINAFCKEAIKENCYTNTPEDRAEEAVFLALRLRDGLDIPTLRALHSVETDRNFEETVSQLVDQGFCTYDGRRLSLTEKGFFVSNTIIVKILESLRFSS